MKRRTKVVVLTTVTITVVVIAGVFGFIKRQSYTDIIGAENFMDQLVVAELGEKMAHNNCEILKEELPNAPIVLRVVPADEMDYLYHAGRQKVTVREIYKGDELTVDQDIYLTFPSWKVSVGEQFNTVQCGFVNVMKEGREYLVFLAESIEDLEGNIIYPFWGTASVVPMFCYEDIENVIAPTQKEHTYVPYKTVMENEFFAETDVALQELLDLKKSMFAIYNNKE